MLVLSGTDGDVFLIGDDTVVTVVRTGDGKIRLGFDAPKCIPIVRGEIATEEQQALIREITSGRFHSQY